MISQNLHVQNQLHDDLSERVQLGFDQFLHSFLLAQCVNSVLFDH